MGLAERTSYRLGFLKSETWDSIRAEALVYWDSICFICLKKDFSNDVHHVYYPDIWNQTKAHHTRVLCRECHDEVHRFMKQNPLVLKPGKVKNQQRCHRYFGEICDKIFLDKGIPSTANDRYDAFSLKIPRSTRRRTRVEKKLTEERCCAF
jgi:hypothetical protein